MLKNKKILLGVTGGIAAYKSCELIRLYQKQGADVKVIMSEAATKFVAPLTFAALSHHEVEITMFDDSIKHIELAQWADILVIAPATANTIAKIACGIADNLLTNIVLAATCPKLVAPAMNVNMYENAATRKNIHKLVQLGIQTIGPDSGYQACGDMGKGRLAALDQILDATVKILKKSNNRKIVITAGPTQEPLDPVRFITNHSSGKMGYALAQAAAEKGYTVKLVSGPTNIPVPSAVEIIKVKTASDMLNAVLHEIEDSDIFIGCAAVADFRSKVISRNKIKKTDDTESLILELVKNPDIIKEVANLHKTFTVGFAAETTNVVEYAKSKLVKKDLDLIIANDVSDSSIGFNSDQNRVSLVFKDLSTEDLPLMNKQDLARVLIDKIESQLGKKR
ncbi:MAG: bifunctional phosphopantothenoylcysteine decarboxylase/phosphopantothenate--cysteine ligase CoaBC [Succinivibrionaceae bacterium]|jgi:phosphopantothenoylcysteine decarboxylase/phosphopantothenate--cysteine ligase|nr:bifunctional phosphopantothenoylcysteine decarboxylase/phosphopantothenate--cysteine ligase CoaBC [Succinivibrionaceae bacterium]